MLSMSLYIYPKHTTEISIRRVVGLLLMPQLSPTAHMLLFLMLVSQVSSGFYYLYNVSEKSIPNISHGSTSPLLQKVEMQFHKE